MTQFIIHLAGYTALITFLCTLTFLALVWLKILPGYEVIEDHIGSKPMLSSFQAVSNIMSTSKKYDINYFSYIDGELVTPEYEMSTETIFQMSFNGSTDNEVFFSGVTTNNEHKSEAIRTNATLYIQSPPLEIAA